MIRGSVRNARIHIGEMDGTNWDVEGLPSRLEIAKVTGLSETTLNQVVRFSMKRMQLHLVAKRIATALPGWTEDGVAEVVAYAVEHRHGAALVLGDLTVDDLLDIMDGVEA